MTNKVTIPEPTAEIRTVGNVTIFDLTSVGKQQGLSVGQKFITTTQAEVYKDACVRAAQQWQPIETAPKSGRSILLGFVNSHGNWRTMLGRWISKEEILNEWEDGDLFDEGWYEISVEADDVPNCWLTNPSHWMPLPLPPTK